MINSIFNTIRNFFPSNRKRAADDTLENQPPHKLIKCDVRGPDMMAEVKENIDNENGNDICVVEEVPRKFAEARRGIKPRNCGLFTSTPVPKQSSSHERRGSGRHEIPLLDLTEEEPTVVPKATSSSNDIQVLKTIRRVPIERGGAFGKAVVARNSETSRNCLVPKIMRRTMGSSINQQRHLRGELSEYRKLLDKYRLMNMSAFTLPAIKAIEAPPPKIEVVDLTSDVRINRNSEQGPSSESARAVGKLKMVEQPVKRVNSLSDFIKFHPMMKAIPDVSDIITRYQTSMKQKQRQAELEETRLAVLRPHNQKAVCSALEERMRDYMKLTEPPITELEEEEKYVLPELTDEQEERISSALKNSPAQQVLAENFGLSVTRRDMGTLKGLNWLNDEVINYYMNLLMERGKQESLPSVYCCNTFFYPKLLSGGHSALKRWTRKVDIFSYKLIFIPIHLGMHWCMAVVDFPNKQIRYYDSMGGTNDRCLKAIMEYLKAESLEKKKTAFDSSGWDLINMDDIPQQMNSSDCGVFACTFAEHLARNAPLLFNQDHMPYFRKKMVLEILDSKLIM